ncbi:MAG: carboxypeptidase regulatory-like domain-containing protein [Bacillota bacterium]
MRKLTSGKTIGLGILLILTLLISGCAQDGPLGDGELGEIMGTVEYNEDPVSGVNVNINDQELTDTETNDDGKYQFSDVPEGTYTLQFTKEAADEVPEIDEEREVTVSGDKTVTKDLSLGSPESDVDDAKDFSNSVRNNGIDLKEVGQTQSEKIDNNLRTEVVPYTVAVAVRMEYAGSIIGFWNESLIGEGPGTYEVVKEGDEWTINDSDEDTDYEEDDEWVWTIELGYIENEEFKSEESVQIGVTNLEKITSEDTDQNKLTVDMSEAVFNYKHTSSIDEDWSWVLNFEHNSSKEKSIIEDDPTDENYDEIEYILPRKSETNIDGSMDDDWEINDEILKICQDIYGDDYEEEIPAFDEIIIEDNTTWNLDFDEDNTIDFDGSISSDYISLDGSYDMNFSEVPSYQDLYDGEALPVIDSYSSSGTITTKTFKLDGSTDIEFSQQEVIVDDEGNTEEYSLPDDLTFEDDYEDLTENDGFKASGTLKVEPDYSNFEIDLTADDMEDEDNYLSFNILFNGSLENMNEAEDVNLDLDFARTGYNETETEFRYDYDGSRYIAGTLEIDDESYRLEASNETGLLIVLDPDNLGEPEFDDEYEEYIGYIKNQDESKYFADIVEADGSAPMVIFEDGETISLIPENN